jgi:PASTA domain
VQKEEIMSETAEQLAGKLPPGRPILKPPLKPPLVPPPPVTFDFSVPSLTVKNPRALETDTDFATIAAAVLAPDGTQIAKYGPTSAFLGNLGKGRTIDPGMSLTGIDVPDGGSVALTFVVVNRGAWEGDSQALTDMDAVGGAVIGALIQGSIAGTGAAVTISIFPAVALTTLVLGALAGLSIVFADCDGTVVAGGMTIGQAELLSNAVEQPWTMTQDYPGTDSAIGCGANSDYTVTYSIGKTPPPVPMVIMPAVIGETPAMAAERLRAAGLQPVEETVASDLDPGFVSGQSPDAGVSVPIGSTVHYTVRVLAHGGHPD